MPEEHRLNQEAPPAEGSASGSAQEEWVPTKEATKLVGASARTLKRRADLGNLRRTSVHTLFGVENRYNKKELEKLKQELFKKGAEVIAEGVAEVRGRRADSAEGQAAGGDTRALSVADHAELGKIIDQKITKITEPFFKLVHTLETGFERMLHAQEQTARSQDQIIEIETARDRERQEDRKKAGKREREERLKDRVIVVCYIVACLAMLMTCWILLQWLYAGMVAGW